MVENKKISGDIIRSQIKIMEENLASLEKEKIKYSKFRKFISGISLNIRIRKRQIQKRKEELQRKIDEGWIE